ncbi:eCIS core domain-containing protein [Oxalicibacterium solurbis]|uniref:eCIS core domain-containing protein n=1 Tax=Oxalicibacterium solurbis TaxID=69280 RepID=A0A8J3AZH3_9BURK|nr:DUF4157 domain-containing protein [Oxalicibacterium solurbis]GGI54366.1 hypothetical protein GCM10011430_15400 [Oxalicibacterium solurbis]
MNIFSDKAQQDDHRAVSTRIGQGNVGTFQFADNRPQTGLQTKLQTLADNSPHVQRTAQLKATMSHIASRQLQPIQKKENKTGLPDNLKSGIESLSGMSMDHVKVHYNSPHPAQLNAHAYAQGSDIHLALGQERHLSHEAWHVVQQMQGRVAPTTQMKQGVPVNDDAGLEQEADAMGAKALVAGSGAADTTIPGALSMPAKGNFYASKSAQKMRIGVRGDVVQKYGDLPREQLTAWVTDHLLNNDSQFNRSASWLKNRPKGAKARKLEWEKQLTSREWKDNPDLGGTGTESALSLMRARFTVPDLASSKYTIVRNQQANLAPQEDAESVHDDIVPEEARPQGGILVSAPLYAGIRDFPARYLQGASDPDQYAFVLAYNAHGLTRSSNRVEAAVETTVGNEDFRGVALGFYWEQKLHDTQNERDVWTNDAGFLDELNTKTGGNEERKSAFASSLRHEKVLGTFPYGMWRNIAMNSQSVNAVMNSPWGTTHAPVMAHVTDPDAATWVDPFTDEHVADRMATQANPGEGTPAHVVKGSYVYASGNDQDSEWDRHVKNIAHTASILDALLRPALNDKTGLSYPAERNLMIRLKGVEDEVNLYQKQSWQTKTTMNLANNVTKDYTGGVDTLFGLADTEGQKLENNVKSMIDGARVLVSSAAVTTDVPARVKSSVAFEAYSTHQQSENTGDMKLASNIKESLLANSTTEMMRRVAGTFSPGKKLAFAEFRDRPRRLWESINTAKNTPDTTATEVVGSIDRQVDSWRDIETAEAKLTTLFEEGEHCATLKNSFLDVLKENHALYHQFSGKLTQPIRVLTGPRDALANEITHMKDQRQTYANAIHNIILNLEAVPAEREEKTTLLASLKVSHDYFRNMAVTQISIFEDTLENIKKRTG